ncbi:MAG TPA: APC family permease [Candidatus Acidoferrales bacterium]|nr:APC family permease [Candidatus Acidoferrales bacterium]
MSDIPAVSPAEGSPQGFALRVNTITPLRLFAASAANIGPAIGVAFYFGVIASAAGVASPLVFIVAGIGFLFHVNTSAQFSRSIPSAGSYAAFIGKTFGRIAGAPVGIFYALCLTLITAGFAGVVGDWGAISLQAWFGVAIPWWVIMIVLVGGAGALCVRGVVISTWLAAGFFFFETAVLLAGAGLMLAHNHSAITSAPFDPRNLTRGALGLGLAFPIALFAMMGASAALPLAEEAQKPRRSLPLAVYSATVIAIAIFVITIWATMVAYHDNLSALTKPAFPFVSGAAPLMGGGSFLLYLAGFTSSIAVTLALANQSARVIYSVSRTGALPRWLGDVHPSFRTPWKSTIALVTSALVIALIVGVWQGVVNEFSYVATLAVAVYVVLLIFSNIALPFFYYQQRRSMFNVWLHAVAPAIGIVALGYPLWLTVTPAQPAPYSYFGLITLALMVACACYGAYRIKQGSHESHVLIDQEVHTASS